MLGAGTDYAFGNSMKLGTCGDVLSNFTILPDNTVLLWHVVDVHCLGREMKIYDTFLLSVGNLAFSIKYTVESVFGAFFFFLLKLNNQLHSEARLFFPKNKYTQCMSLGNSSVYCVRHSAGNRCKACLKTHCLTLNMKDQITSEDKPSDAPEQWLHVLKSSLRRRVSLLSFSRS